MVQQVEGRPQTQLDGTPEGSGRARRTWRVTDLVIALGVVVLLLFPVAARLWANALPIAPPSGPPLPPIVGHAGGEIRDLPEFLTVSPARAAQIVAGGVTAETVQIDRLAGDVFGRAGARLLRRGLAVPIGAPLPRLPTVAGSRLGEENDLAALLIEAAAISEPTAAPLNGSFGYALTSAGPLALELLNAAGRAGACVPLVNKAFLLASQEPDPEPTLNVPPYERAVAACPRDPTALWALGEYQSVAVSTAAAAATFATLEHRFPRTGGAWSGAGDNAMRTGYVLEDDNEPFSARLQFARALGLYRRAEILDPGPGSRSGIARALAALNQPRAAVAVQRRALVPDPDSAELQARLLDYLQRAHEFAAASKTAARLAAVHRVPIGPALFAEPPPPLTFQQDGTAAAEDAGLPMSIGADTMAPVVVALAPAPGAGATAEAEDLSYLPVFTPMSGVGGLARWCPRWSRLVDLLLAGHPGQVLGNPSGSSEDLRPTLGDCDAQPSTYTQMPYMQVDVQEVAGVAELELGRVAQARADGRAVPSADSGPVTLSYLEDLRQNLWRYAGNYSHAAMAAAQWAKALPDDEAALSAEGEIAFLRHRYDDAATYFALAVNRARYQSETPTAEQALALLDQGTALVFAGRRTEALATLAVADQTGIGAYVASRGVATGGIYATYAEEEAGNVRLGSNDPVAAAQDYAVAAQPVGLSDAPVGSLRVGPSVLDNNFAIAEIAIGNPSMAASLARDSIADDPGDAIFWWTEADAQQQLGHWAAAISDYRASLARDPSEFPAANDLGVLLVERGEDEAAVSALRRSVGAAPDYATGWFNLGVALGREGPAHLIASEGSLARAEKLDSRLATRAPKPFLDNAVYLSHLDLSKPLPPKWTFASSQSNAPVAAAGISTILLMALALARSFAARATQGNAQKWLNTFASAERRLDIRVLGGPALAIIASIAFLLWPLRSGPDQGWAFVLPYAVGLAILIAAVLRVRRLAAWRAGLQLHEDTWLPGVGLGLVMTAVGLGWTPLPVARVRGRATAVHWAGPTTVAVLAIALLLLATWLNVPVTRSLGAAALVMAASMLTPVKPLDGATVSATPAGHLPVVAVLGTAVLVIVGLL